MGTLLSLPGVIGYIGAILLGIIGGGLYLLSLFRQSRTANTKEGESALAFVNSAFEKKIKILEDQLKEQAQQIADQDKRLVAVEKENVLLREILQGKDERAVEFQTKGLEVINTAVPEILTLTKETNKSVNQLCKSIDGLVKAMNVQTTTTVVTTPVTK